MIVYLDNASTTKPCEAAVAASLDMLVGNYGNPSSVHTMGQDAERVLKRARADVASLCGARPEQIVFTGSGTEADNLAFHSVFKNPSRISGKHIIVSRIEHPAVMEPASYYAAAHGAKLIELPVSAEGMVMADALADALSSAAAAQRAAIISVMHVNNELGTIQPLTELVRIRDKVNRRYGADIMLHTDAIQSFGKLPMSVPSGAPGSVSTQGAYADFSGVDLISFSAHKIHGQKGVGALYAARPEKLAPLIRGGRQESGMRSGTENMPGIAGFGAAAQNILNGVLEGAGAESSACALGDGKRVALLRERLLKGIKDSIPDVLINSPETASASGEPGCCSPYILNVSFLGTRGEVIVHDLEQHEVFVSTGSACSNIGKAGKGVSANSDTVLSAIGRTAKEAEGAIRFSFGLYNTEDEIDYALEQLSDAVGRYRRIGAYR